MAYAIDLTGERFGMLVVQRRVHGNGSDGSARWKCRCDCGNTRIVSSYNLKRGATLSCGCTSGRVVNKMLEQEAKRGRGKDMRQITLRPGVQKYCTYNAMIDCCSTLGCKICGWNPAVQEARIAKIREKLGETTQATDDGQSASFESA